MLEVEFHEIVLIYTLQARDASLTRLFKVP